MKRIVKLLMAVTLAILLLFVDCLHVSAKNVYDMKYGNLNTKKPYKKVNKKIAQIEVDIYGNYRAVCKKDFNGDGKKEKVAFTVREANNYRDVKIDIKNSSRVVIKRKVSGEDANFFLFRTMKVQGKCLAALVYGDEDYASGGALIFLWGKNNIKLLKSYNSKGYLDIYTGRDRTLNKDILYIEDAQQLYNRYGHKWPSNVLKKYKKYANEEYTSVTKTTYHKYVYKNGVLKKVGKDNYYRVGIYYD